MAATKNKRVVGNSWCDGAMVVPSSASVATDEGLRRARMFSVELLRIPSLFPRAYLVGVRAEKEKKTCSRPSTLQKCRIFAIMLRTGILFVAACAMLWRCLWAIGSEATSLLLLRVHANVSLLLLSFETFTCALACGFSLLRFPALPASAGVSLSYCRFAALRHISYLALCLREAVCAFMQHAYGNGR